MAGQSRVLLLLKVPSQIRVRHRIASWPTVPTRCGSEAFACGFPYGGPLRFGFRSVAS
jgi:hypothetical protein